ncbi:hypothetical protein [Sphingomonas sp.]
MLPEPGWSNGFIGFRSWSIVTPLWPNGEIHTLSDNRSAPPDEEPIDFVNIVARVVFVGKRT